MNKIVQELLRIAKIFTAYNRGWEDVRSNALQTSAKFVTFQFRNKALEELWNDEISGQISDGAWENTPRTGWEFWTSIKTTIGSPTKLVGTLPYGVKRGFALTGLIEYVGDRMLETIKKYEPEATERTLRDYLTEIAEAMRKGEAIPRGGTEPLDKDNSRISDMIKKSNGIPVKLIALGDRMAKSIDDNLKCIRRGRAAENAITSPVLQSDEMRDAMRKVADLFFERAKVLAKERL